MPSQSDPRGETRRLSKARFGAELEPPESVPGAECLSRMLSHRTHRDYDSAPVDERLLRLLFACALSTPSKSDLQQADIIHVRDKSKRRAFAALIPSMPWISSAPVFLVFCGNNRRLRQVSRMHGETFANDHLDAFFNAAVDAGIVLSAFIQAAEAAGLGCCPISAVRNHAGAVNDLLALPEWVFPVAGMCVGYPASAGRISQRLPLEVTVHTDAFDESRFDERLHAYDARRAAAMPEADRVPWSQAKAKQYSVPQRTDFGAYLRRKGFNLS